MECHDAMMACSAGMGPKLTQTIVREEGKVSSKTIEEHLRILPSVIELLPENERAKDLEGYRQCLTDFLRPQEKVKTYSEHLADAFNECKYIVMDAEKKIVNGDYAYVPAVETLLQRDYVERNNDLGRVWLKWWGVLRFQ